MLAVEEDHLPGSVENPLSTAVHSLQIALRAPSSAPYCSQKELVHANLAENPQGSVKAHCHLNATLTCYVTATRRAASLCIARHEGHQRMRDELNHQLGQGRIQEIWHTFNVGSS